MAFEGSLSDSPLPDVLRELGLKTETGILTLQGRDEIIGVTFLDGEVVSVDAVNQAPEDGLGQLLEGSGLISREDFSGLVAEHHAGGGRVADLLVERGYLDRQQFLEVLRQHTLKLCAEACHWPDGQYRFYRGDQVSFEPGVEPVKVEDLLARLPSRETTVRDRAPAAQPEAAPPPAAAPQPDASPPAAPPQPEEAPAAVEPLPEPVAEPEPVLEVEVEPLLPAEESAEEDPVELPTAEVPVEEAAGEEPVTFEPEITEADLDEDFEMPDFHPLPEAPMDISELGLADRPEVEVLNLAAEPAMEVEVETEPEPEVEPEFESLSQVPLAAGAVEPIEMPDEEDWGDLDDEFEALRPKRRPLTDLFVGWNAVIAPVMPGRVVGVAMLVSLVALVILVPERFLVPLDRQERIRNSVALQVRESLYAKVDRAAKTYFLLRGGFPESLDDLVAMDLLSQADTQLSATQPLAYTEAPVSYVLAVEGELRVDGSTQTETITGNFLLDPDFSPPELIDTPPLVLLD